MRATQTDLKSLVLGGTASVREVLAALDGCHADRVFLVDEDGRLRGCVDERAMRRALLAGARLEDPAAPLAEAAPVVVQAPIKRADVLDLMRARAVSAVPALDATGHLVELHLIEQLLGAVERPNWAVLMAGGKGRRLAPLTNEVPKPMLPVAGRPILERLVLHLVGCGIRTIFLSINHLGHLIEDHFGDGTTFGCRIRYLREQADRPLGSGGSLGLLAESGYLPDHPLLVLNGDLVTDLDIVDLLASHEAQDVAATIAVSEYRHEVPFGVVEANGHGLARLVEKPVLSWLVNAGVYVLEPRLLQRIPPGLNYPITALFDECLRHDEHVNVWQLQGDWQDIGQHLELARARGQL